MPHISTSGPALKGLLAALLCLLSACDNGASDNAASPEATNAAPSPARVEGEVFRDALKDGGEGPEMVALPAGIFRMGDLSADESGDEDEREPRLVAIRRPFAMGRYEVTFEDYDRFVLATGADIPDDEGWGRGSRPAINVSQEDAKAYAV